MPLIKEKTEKAFQENVAELIRSGHPQEQALAIAYKILRGEDVTEQEACDEEVTHQLHDLNGWIEVKDNPISRAGVFPYRGSSIGAPDPDKVYMVLRPPEELQKPETLNSFKLVPLVEDHTMLGSADTGFTAAEMKGVQGVIGEEVYFKDDTIFSNLKIFSNRMISKIKERIKRELSCGYRCVYEFVSGEWNGQHYDAIQRNIRGNHLALVDAGRMGPDVAVLDHLTLTYDEKDIFMEEEEKKAAEDQASVEERLAKIEEVLAELVKSDKKVHAEMDESEEEEKKEEEKGEDEEEEKKEEKEEKSGMDAAEIRRSAIVELGKRDRLASKLSGFVGSFDHSEMTLEEVAKYGVKKLGITCDAGMESAALAGYLHGRKPESAEKSVFDHKSSGKRSEAVAKYFE